QVAKPAVLLLIAAGWLAAGGAVGVAADRLHRPGWAYPLVLGLGLWLAAGAVLLPALGQDFFGASAAAGALMSSLFWSLVVAAYILILKAAAWALPHLAGPPAPVDRVRRRLVRRLALGVVAAGAVVVLGRWLWALTHLTTGALLNAGGLPPEVTPTSDFYTVSKNFFDPDVNEARWELEVSGLVEQPFTLSYQELLALDGTQQYLTLACISNEVGGHLMGNALWRGIRLSDLLGRAGVRPGAIKVVLTGEDGYSDSFPLDKALESGTLLAYHMNDEPLTTPHGFPLRALVPGIYGMKNGKWLKRMEVVDYDFQGYWQERGWSDQAVIKTSSRIDLPAYGDSYPDEVAVIGGVAFAGDQGISQVEVSTNGGRTWLPAEVKKSLSPFTWVLWLREWDPTPGRYELLVRATDSTGGLQTAERHKPLPDGASGYHRVVVRIQKPATN
ncbi:MAG: molybdopterin-dependent oxidoreductase, partial [Dehalococcoidia bacterium]